MDMKKRDGQLVVTPNPVTLDDQRIIEMDLRPGESLYAFLSRHIHTLDGDKWEVSIGGRAVERHLWHCVYPKHGQVIEVRGGVGKTALLIVALIALTVFTAGVGTAMVAAGYSALAAYAVQAVIYIAGSLIINKVLGPKKPKQYPSDADNVYSISSQRNSARQYEPFALTFGRVRVAPDLISAAYAFYESNDQYMAMVLTPGINVGRIEDLYNGDTLLSTYEGVSVWHNNYPEMPSEEIPLYSNVDAVSGGDLTPDNKGEPGPWVMRTSSPNTVRLQVDIEYNLFDTTSKGAPKVNQETIQIQYRAVGTTSWNTLANRYVQSKSQKTQRITIGYDVPEGQYEVQTRIAGQNTDGSGATANFTWTALSSIQNDPATYPGIPRTGVKIKGSGQLAGALDEVRAIVHSTPAPVWYESGEWVTEETSNPGAHILRYARGIYDENGVLIAGLGLNDAQIDIEALKGFMLHCADNNYTYDYCIKDPRSHLEVMDTIALAGMGQTNWAGGKLSISWAAADQPTSGVVNMATIKKGAFQVDYTLAQAADGIEYSYYDSTTWKTETLRVPAPGVTTMLNPAQVTGEGVSTEAHAAILARYHMAQNLYQYKDISYSTDLEHLSYRRMSVLSMQHDMTQWGFGGRIVSASKTSGVTTLVLDDTVPPPTANNGFIGLRIPGEAVYRVFQVVNFSAATNTVTLVGAWPNDAAFPGDTSGNPAWDTIWCYDFKSTPGLRVRVVGVEPENGLKGARVTCVAESDEFWHYVETGEYIPPNNESLLQTKPIASNLRVTENHVVQGDTVYTELQVVFDITGAVGDIVCLSDLDGNVELEEVARTVTRSVSFRIPAAGTYPITIRPFAPDGTTGVSASVIYTTQGADAPPVLVDLFDVIDGSGGVRKYTWGFFTSTIQSADFTGVEIRYITATSDTEPAWDTMTPVGDTGYHASAFEAVIPASGNWTFACRSVNTAGTLSTTARYITKTLGKNLGEIQTDQQNAINQNTQDIIDGFNRVAEEQQALVDELNAQAAELENQANELATQANDIAANSTAIAQHDVELAAQQSQIDALQSALDAPDWDSTIAYPAGSMVKYDGRLYSAKMDVPVGTLPTNTTYWQDLGEYSSLADQVAANSAAISMLDSRVDAAEDGIDSNANAITGVASRVTTLEGEQSATTLALNQLTTRVSTAEGNITAQGTAITQLQTRMTTAEGNISVNTDAIGALTTTVTSQGGTITAQGNAITALTTRVTTAESNININNNAIQDLNTLTTAQGNTIAAQGNAITSLTTSLGNIGGDNLLSNSSFETRTSDTVAATGWVLNANVDAPAQTYSYSASGLPGSTVAMRMTGTASNINQYVGIEPVQANRPKAVAGQKYTSSVFARGTAGKSIYIIIQFMDASNNGIRTDQSPAIPATDTLTRYSFTSAAAPANTASVRVIYRLVAGVTGTPVYLEIDNAQFQQGEVATQWAPSVSEVAATSSASASAITALNTRVTNAENTITAQGTAITQVQSGLSNIGGDNLLSNSSFETRTSDTVAPTNWTFNGLTPAYSYPASPLPGSSVAVRVAATSTATNQNLGIEPIAASRPKAVAGQKYTASVFAAGTPGLNFYFIVNYLDASLAVLRSDQILVTNALTSTLTRYAVTTAAAPANTVNARVLTRLVSSAASQNMELLLDNMQFQQGEVATQWAPSAVEIANAGAANASAITALTTRVTNAENSISSQANSITSLTSSVNLTQQAGNNIMIDAGFESYADGTVLYSSGNGTLTVTTADAYRGTKSLRLVRPTAASSSNTDTYLTPTITTSAGRVYYLEAYAKLDPAAPAPDTTQFRIGLNVVVGAATGNWLPASTLVNASTLTDWTKVSGYVVMPANASTARFWVNFPGYNAVQNAAVFIDNLIFQDVTDGYNAQQTGAANASAITALTTRVTAAENNISSQASSITTISAQLGSAQAQGANLVLNGTLEGGTTGWTLDATWSVAATEGRSGGGCLKNVAVGTTATRNAVANNNLPSQNVPVTPGRTYRWSCYYKTTADFNGTANNAKLRLATQTDGLIGGLPFAANKTDWTLLQDIYTVPNTVSALRIRATCDSSVGTLWIDDVWIEDITDAKANSDAISALSTTVTAQGNTITAQGTAITNLQTSVAGKADASALTALTTRVTTVENTVTTQGTAITNVKASMPGGGNLLINPTWEADVGYWALIANDWGSTLTRNVAGSDWTPINGSCAGWAGTGTPAGWVVCQSAQIPIKGNATYVGSVYTAAHRCRTYMTITCFDAAGAQVGEVISAYNVSPSSGQGGKQLSNWIRLSAKIQTPANTAQCTIRLFSDAATGATPYAFFTQAMIEEATPDKVGPSPWSNGSGGIDSKYASATQSLSARVTTTENGISSYNASWQVTLNAGGYITGVQSVNNGVKGTFTILADNFVIAAPAGGQRTEYSNGNWRVYDASGVLRVAMGVNI